MKNNIYSLIPLLLLIAVAATSCLDGDSEPPPPIYLGKNSETNFIAIHDDLLYTIQDKNLVIFRLDNSGDLIEQSKFSFDYQTAEFTSSLFIRDERLVVFANYGCKMYDLTTSINAETIPTYLQVRKCSSFDFKGDYVFSTENVNCDYRFTEGVNVSSISDPSGTSLKSLPLTAPLDLRIEGNLLFVGCGDYGLSIFDVTDPADFTLVKTYEDINALEVQAESNVLIVKTPSGIDQYDYSDPTKLELLSHIPIGS